MAAPLLSAEPGLAIPQRPPLAVAAEGCCPPIAGTPLGPREVLNIVSTVSGETADGFVAYGVVAGSNPREGWVPASLLRPLTAEETSQSAAEERLSVRDLVQHCSFVQATEDWHDPEDSQSSMPLCLGNVLQLSAVKPNGWAHGHCMIDPAMRGWFPMAFVKPVESSLGTLAYVKSERFYRRKDRELSASSASAFIEMLTEARERPPAPRPWVWDGDLPSDVAASAQQGERAWQESFAKIDADQAEKERIEQNLPPASLDELPQGPHSEAPREDEEADEAIPDDCYPIVVCKVAFFPPNGARGALLRLQVGDLARVTSLLDATMYHGFLETNPAVRGWFPRKNVQLLEDPLDTQAGGPPPTYISAPPLPVLPPGLLQRKRGA